jgi:hypothetical protein
VALEHSFYKWNSKLGLLKKNGVRNVGKGADATGDGGPGYDGQDRAAGVMHGDDGVSFVIPLEFAGDGDTVGEMKVGVVVTEEGLGSEEMENAQMEELGSALLLLGSGVN